jgi:hypothetical protein
MTPEEQRFSAGLLPVAQRSAAGSGRPAYVGLYEDPALVGLSPRRQERPSCSACVATSPGAGCSGSPRRTTRRSRRSTVFSGSVRSSIHCSCSAPQQRQGPVRRPSARPRGRARARCDPTRAGGCRGRIGGAAGMSKPTGAVAASAGRGLLAGLRLHVLARAAARAHRADRECPARTRAHAGGADACDA